MSQTERHAKRGIPEGLWLQCPACKATVFRKDVEDRLNVCPECDHHFYVSARDRLRQLLDENSFEEWDAGLRPTDALGFSDSQPYAQRIAQQQKKTGMPDAAVCGAGFIRGRGVVVGVTDFAFMAGSMGAVVGEKLSRAAERAADMKRPLIFVSGSGGGARMQEGILSLMQMAKVSAALARYHAAGGLYVCILTHPTMGGVAASWAFQGDVTLAEPKAMVGFAGARTIKNTIQLELPDGFQTSEFLLKHGFVDRVVHRKDIRTEVSRLVTGTLEGCRVSFFSKLFGGGGGKRKVVEAKKRWDLQSRAGQGSMSKVWKAFDRELGRTVAVKLNDKVKTAKFEEKFKLQGLTKPPEGEICVSLRHDNIVKTFEHGVTTQGEPYLVMEWVEGMGLNFLIDSRHQQMNGNRVNFVGQLCDAIQFLHDSKYLHRDLCPRNVMVTTDGVVKLIDFGLTIPYTPAFCQPGNRTGTVDYLAPEVIKRSTTDHRVDLFALGCTAFEIFTGQLPWEKSLNSDETVRRRLNSPPRQAKVLKPDMTDELARVLMKSIEIDRNARFATATDFKEALQAMKKTDY